ncbi:Homeodomain-like domain protein [uncultured archaeon]|nr:Homeodomain-like domain protein [uncultured archaeon]
MKPPRKPVKPPVKEYAPMPGTIRRAIFQGRNKGRSWADIRSDLAARGINTTSGNLQSQASQLRAMGVQLPYLPQHSMGLTKERVLAILQSEEERQPRSQLAAKLGVDRSTVTEWKNMLRKKGVPLEKYLAPRGAKPRKILQPTPAQAKWINENYGAIASHAREVAKWKISHPAEAELFVNFVIDELPKLLSNYDPSKRPSKLDYVKTIIRRFLPADFWRQRTHERLGIVSTGDVKVLGRLLREIGGGLSLEASAKKLGVDQVKAKRLVDLYTKKISLDSALPFRPEK